MKFHNWSTAQNDCDESGAGAGINDAALRYRCLTMTFDIDPITQTNAATGADNAAQTNDFSVVQSSDLENNCDEFEDGTNDVFCNIEDIDNDIDFASRPI